MGVPRRRSAKLSQAPAEAHRPRLAVPTDDMAHPEYRPPPVNEAFERRIVEAHSGADDVGRVCGAGRSGATRADAFVAPSGCPRVRFGPVRLRSREPNGDDRLRVEASTRGHGGWWCE